MLVAALYAIPVVYAVWANFPTEAQIDAYVASSAITALQQSDVKYKNVTPLNLRRRLYRGLTDQEVTARIREQALAEERRVTAETGTISVDAQPLESEGLPGSMLGNRPDQSTPPSAVVVRLPLALAMEDLEKARAERIGALKAQQVKAIVFGIFAWLVPVVALYFLGPYLGTLRPKRVRRI